MGFRFIWKPGGVDTSYYHLPPPLSKLVCNLITSWGKRCNGSNTDEICLLVKVNLSETFINDAEYVRMVLARLEAARPRHGHESDRPSVGRRRGEKLGRKSSMWVIYTLNGLYFAALLFLTSLGLNIILGVMGILNLAHGSLYAIGAFMAAWTIIQMVTKAPAPLLYVCLLSGLVLAGIVGWVMEKTLLVGDYLFVSKLSFGPKVPNTPLSFPFVHHTLPLTENTKSYLEWRRRIADIDNA
jgi:hypothetical protein